MASCSQSEFTCVVWKINSIQSTMTSEPFTLFDCERKLDLNYEYQRNTSGYYSLKVKLKPWYSSCSRVRVLALAVNDDGSILHSSNKEVSSQHDELFSMRISCSFSNNKRMKIVCIFQDALPVSHNSPDCETICLTTSSPVSNLENLSSDFDEFLKDKTFTDVTLKCRDRAISAHRAVLAARSPVFAAMFRNKMAECENGVVEIDDLDPDTLESFLKFIYSGRITDLSEKNASILFSTSDKYDVRRLQQHCSKWIVENLTLENCIGFLQLADAHNYEDLRNSVVEFIVRDTRVFQREEWTQFKDLNTKLANFVYEKYICKLSNVKIA